MHERAARLSSNGDKYLRCVALVDLKTRREVFPLEALRPRFESTFALAVADLVHAQEERDLRALEVAVHKTRTTSHKWMWRLLILACSAFTVIIMAASITAILGNI